MANKKGFKAVSLESLNDSQLDELVLSNWHKLNTALKAVQPIPVLRRLLMIELAKGSSARPVIAERVRSSLSRALAQRSKRGLDELLDVLILPAKKLDRDDFLQSTCDIGLEIDEADFVFKKLKESA